ncbi:hypothetical protein BSKO_09261 [Bryopsis sp. KO-2023]|nr:hypothetical protein BSKO_09261 [Bryopsis sp. KO-2023]
MVMKVAEPGGVKVYNVSGGKSLPDWVKDRKSRRKYEKDNEGYKTRLELIQDFNFPTSCRRLKVTEDQQHIVSSGTYPPQTKVFEVANLSLKFSRHFEADVVEFQILTEDYSKLVFLCRDRYLRFHAKFGHYYELRLPSQCQDMSYIPFTGNLAIVGSESEIYRLDLSEGRFNAPLATRMSSISACGYSPSHGLFGCVGDDGILECFDLRQNTAVGAINAAKSSGAPDAGLTSLRFDDSGFNVAVGTTNGLVSIFDLRSQKPMLTKDHMYGAPIIDIKFHSASCGGDMAGVKRVISSDTHIVKVWSADTGKSFTNIEPQPGELNDVCVWKDSGLIMVALEDSAMQTFFVPSLGPAPKWCSFLEGLTEELEEDVGHSLYDDYRFISQSDVAKLGLTHLIGTPMLKAYMHGYFMDDRLYKKAQSVSDPLVQETERQKHIKKKMEEERQSRIGIVRKMPKVNAKEAARILLRKEGEEKSDAATAAAAAGGGSGGEKRKRENLVGNPMEDSRFKAMFEDQEFAIDEESADFKLLHRKAKPLPKAFAREVLGDHFSEGESDDDIRKTKHGRNEPQLVSAQDDAALDVLAKPETKAQFEQVALGERAAELGKQQGGNKPFQMPARGNVEFKMTSDGGGGKKDGKQGAGGQSDEYQEKKQGRLMDWGDEGRPGGRGYGRGRGRGGRGERGRGRGRSSGRGRSGGRGGGRRGGRR